MKAYKDHVWLLLDSAIQFLFTRNKHAEAIQKVTKGF